MFYNIFFSNRCINTCFSALSWRRSSNPENLYRKFEFAHTMTHRSNGAVIQLTEDETRVLRSCVDDYYNHHILDVELVDTTLVYKTMLEDILEPIWTDEDCDVK